MTITFYFVVRFWFCFQIRVLRRKARRFEYLIWIRVHRVGSSLFCLKWFFTHSFGILDHKNPIEVSIDRSPQLSQDSSLKTACHRDGSRDNWGNVFTLKNNFLFLHFFTLVFHFFHLILLRVSYFRNKILEFTIKTYILLCFIFISYFIDCALNFRCFRVEFSVVTGLG